MSEGTRAPWAKAPAATGAAPTATGAPTAAPFLPAPGAGASVTRAPWASGSASAGNVMHEGTRAPWAQGVSIGNAGMDKMDWDVVARLHPEYTQSVGGEGAGAEAGASAAAASTAGAAATPAYSVPCKMIKNPTYMPLWPQTCAHAELTSFILLLNERVRGIPCAQPGMPSRRYSVSPAVQLLVTWLTESRDAVAHIPPLAQSMRFGNKAFRTWHEQRVSGPALATTLAQLVGPEQTARGAVAELLPYAQDAFGSTQRIDYGTGHELNFVLLLCALNKLGVFTGADLIPLVLEVFAAYVSLMQTLQRTYWLEPAGSKGAWGLDDYCFLPFLWGSSQLQGSSVKPTDFLNRDVVDSSAPRFLFLRSIQFIHTVKTGPFEEHSAFLHHISTLPSWQKANQGLLRMYEAEVLGKFPIVQHVLFGRLLKFTKYVPGAEQLGSEAVVEREEREKQQGQGDGGGGAAAAATAVDSSAAEPALPSVPRFEGASSVAQGAASSETQ